MIDSHATYLYQNSLSSQLPRKYKIKIYSPSGKFAERAKKSNGIKTTSANKIPQQNTLMIQQDDGRPTLEKHLYGKNVTRKHSIECEPSPVL